MSKNTKKKIKAIGLIVEDNSDFTSLKIILSRLIGKDNFTFKKAVGNGCGKMKKKALSYANILHRKGCDLVIITHDLDRNNLQDLRKELSTIMNKSNSKNKFVCIPNEEIEAWFLRDPEGIRDTFELNRIPNIKGNPEIINSPKEKLEDYVYQCSEKSKIYLNTKHNDILSTNLNLEKISKRCNSFKELKTYINKFEF